MSTPIEGFRLTRMRKAGQALLSKRISLGEDGKPVSDGAECRMTHGSATRVVLDPWGPATDLAELIGGLGSHEALVLGDHVGADEQIEIGLAKRSDPAKGRYDRTLDTFKFRPGEAAVALLDFDQKAISDGARQRIEEHGGFEGALAALIPGYPKMARVVRASTSAGIYNADTGETFPGSGGQHVYLFAKHGADIQRFLEDLQKRAWLAGLGWIMVSKRGRLLIRSIVDTTVGSPERLVFEGKPDVLPPLAQDEAARRPVVHEGELLDTVAACKPLSPDEARRYSELVAAAKLEKQPEVEIAKEEAAVEIATSRSIPIEKARAVVEASTNGELWSWDSLDFDDATIGVVAVADVLADPARFHGETLADPIEGRSYGRGKAQVYWNGNNTVVVNSFAHGGCVYRVHHDADFIEQKVEDAGEDAPFVLADLMARAGNFDAVTRERLRDLAAKLGKVGKRAVAQTVKETAQKAKRAAGAAARERGARSPGTAKPSREELVLLGGERPTQLRTIAAKLRSPHNVGTGSIVMRGQTAAVIRTAIDPAELVAGKQTITLPTGSAYLTVPKPEHLQAHLDRMFAFARVSQEGEQYAVDCPGDLARYVLANAEMLPLAFISRTPVLRADGSVLDRPGYDPATAIYYAPSEAFPAIPGEPTQEDAAAGLNRLMRPFRGFPFVTDVDRHMVAAEVLTLLTRHLVSCVPGFGHNAVEPGTGKSELFKTIGIIALGVEPPVLNADILDDETEFKKVMTTLTLAASPLAVFDNMKRGGQLTSAGLSNYLTASVYGDRLLGSNTEVKAATCTIIGLTGNAIEIVGDNTRRIFRIDLDAGVERPETRTFDFDCKAEAKRDRGELVAAALTILRAHALADWPAVPERGRLGSFEDWDRLVAGAITFAGGPDIVSLLDKTRAADPERDDLAEVLRMLEGIGATSPMKTGDIIREVDKRKSENLRSASEGHLPPSPAASEWHEMMCRMSRDDKPNARKLGRYLTKNAGRIVGGLQLISAPDAHSKVNAYYVRPAHPASAAMVGSSCGICGVSGINHSRSTSQEHKNINTDGKCNKELFLRGGGSDRLSETPQNPQTPQTAHPAAPASNGSTDWFAPGPEWVEVPAGATVVAGCEFRLDMTTGKQMARMARS